MKLKKYLLAVLSVVLIGGMSLSAQASEVVETEDASVEEVAEEPSITGEGPLYVQAGDYYYTVLSNGTAEIGWYTGNATNLTIPSTLGGKKVTSIGDGAFNSCSSLAGVTIPNSVTSIGDGAFGWCTSLTKVIIPNSVTSIGYGAFYECSSLTEVIIPNSVTSIGDLGFYGCSSLAVVIIPDSVTSIGTNAFANTASNLTVYCNSGSYASTYVSSNGISYSLKKYFPQCTITLSSTTYTYDGNAKKPTVTVKDGTKTLKKDTDYTVTYSNNVKIGKATVTIVGKGNYKGTVKKTFTIIKADYYNLTQNGGTWNGTYYYLGGVKMTDIFFCDETYTYYLQADGTPMKNRLTYHPDGVHLIYLDDKGHELFDQFQYCKDVGYTCYFDTYGYLYKNEITFSNDKAYYLDGTGRMKQNEWFIFDNGVDIGYANEDGSLNNQGFGYDPWGRVVYYHWNGMVARGLITDGAWYYHMDETDGHLIGQFAVN